MGYNQNNKAAKKLKTPELREACYKEYCAHLARGKSKRSFVFKYRDLSCTYRAIEKCIEEDDDLDPAHKEVAEAEGFAYWETIVEEAAKGTNKDANTASLQMLMRNKFGWDKDERTNEEKVAQAIDSLAKIREYLSLPVVQQPVTTLECAARHTGLKTGT
jgi:hypothetical protein